MFGSSWLTDREKKSCKWESDSVFLSFDFDLNSSHWMGAHKGICFQIGKASPEYLVSVSLDTELRHICKTHARVALCTVHGIAMWVTLQFKWFRLNLLTHCVHINRKWLSKGSCIFSEILKATVKLKRKIVENVHVLGCTFFHPPNFPEAGKMCQISWIRIEAQEEEHHEIRKSKVRFELNSSSLIV